MTIDEWNHALSQIHVGEHAELEFARTWADSVEVDYDEGPCAIGFMKNGGTYWYLIDDVGWDADDPRSEMLAAALEERNAARAECERLRGLLGGACKLAREAMEAYKPNREPRMTYDRRLAEIRREGGIE